MTDNAVVVENVSKEFVLRHNRVMSFKGHFIGIFNKRWRQRSEHFRALDDVSFTVPRGQALGLLGANGSGKSTLMQIIANIFPPSSGRVLTNGRIAPLIELGVGFHPELTGEENIYLNASLYGFRNRDIRARYRKIVDFSELGDFIDIPVKNYSSGMQMRLGFSVAVHLDPDILLADEILAVGDASFQAKCHERILALQNNGMTLILVSHNRLQIETFCTQFIRLDHGRVVESGLTRQPAAAPAVAL